MEQYNEGRIPRRNAGPTPPTPPAALQHSRTYNPNAYESSADIVARRNAQNALRNTIRGSDNRADYMAGAISSQRGPMAMPPLPRQGMTGLTPSTTQAQMPFHYYPEFGTEQHAMDMRLDDIDAEIGNFQRRKNPMGPMGPINPENGMPFGGGWSAPMPPTRGIDPSVGMGGVKKGMKMGLGALSGMAGLGMSLADMTPEEMNQLYLYLSRGGAFSGEEPNY